MGGADRWHGDLQNAHKGAIRKPEGKETTSKPFE